MKPLTEFLPEVLPFVPECPQPVALNAIRNSVIEFVGRAGLIEQTIQIGIGADVSEYSIDLDTGLKPVLFLRGFLNNANRITPTSPLNLDAKSPFWPTMTGEPTSAFIRQNLFVVVPKPIADAEVTATFSCTYQRSISSVEDFILENHAEGIAKGALYRLFELPGVPWANPVMAVEYKNRFEAAMSIAVVANAKGSTTNGLSVEPRSFC